MSTLNIINKIIIFENILCVFRNYQFLKPKTQNFVKLYVFLVIFTFVCAGVIFFQISVVITEKTSSTFMNSISFILYYVLTTLNSIFAIVLGLRNEKFFKSYIDCTNAINKLCGDDDVYKKAIDRLNKRVYKVVFVVTVLILAITLGYFLEIFKFVSYFAPALYLAGAIFDITLQFRYILESLAYYVFTEVIIASLQYVNNSVATYIHELKYNKADLSEDHFKFGDDLVKWAVVSGQLSKCGDQLSSCFGVQIGMTLFTSTVYYILLLYKCGYSLMTLDRELSISGYSVLVFLTEYLMVNVLILVAGQRMRNEADQLNTALASLQNLLVHVPEQADDSELELATCAQSRRGHAAPARTVRALSRRLRAAPVRAELLSMPVQMSLFVGMLAVTADYTLILLQFNHVV